MPKQPTRQDRAVAALERVAAELELERCSRQLAAAAAPSSEVDWLLAGVALGVLAGLGIAYAVLH